MLYLLSARYTMADFMNFPTSRERTLRYGDSIVGIIPELSLVSHFQVGSWPVLYRPASTGNVKRWGLPLMIPNFSRLKDGIFKEKGTTLPIHGFGRNLPWSIRDQSETSISIQLKSSSTTLVSYPYEFVFTATIEVAEGSLTYSLLMENPNNEVMPIAPGFHPYFTLAQGDKAQIVTDGPPGFDPTAFQWDTNPPDNPYSFPHLINITFPQLGTLTITELPWKGKYSLSTMQVWSEPATAPDHDFVCFEPVVTNEDGLNRPADRINIPAHSSHQIILQLIAKPM